MEDRYEVMAAGILGPLVVVVIVLVFALGGGIELGLIVTSVLALLASSQRKPLAAKLRSWR